MIALLTQVAEKLMLAHCEQELAQRARIVSETQAQICLPPFAQVLCRPHFAATACEISCSKYSHPDAA